MTHHYATPGVYIEEITGPGVIPGVGTGTAAFIGAALGGPINEARRITSFDEFLELYATRMPDGSYWPYITTPRRLYMADAVRGFFENEGSQAYIVRAGTGVATIWEVSNVRGDVVFRVQARREGVAADAITVEVQAANATGGAGVAVARGSAGVRAVAAPASDGTVDVTVDDSRPFQPVDVVTKDETDRPSVTRIRPATIAGFPNAGILTLSYPITGLAAGDTLRIANIRQPQSTFRVVDATALFPGSVVLIDSSGDYAVVDLVDRAGFVTLAPTPARTADLDLTAGAPRLISQEFRLIITPGNVEIFDNLSLDSRHPGYVFSAVDSEWIRILPSLTPSLAGSYPDRLVDAVGAVGVTVAGVDDDPAALTSVEYEAGLDVLRHVDDVNMICIPDAAAHAERFAIQQAMIGHCLDLEDRFTILDSEPGVEPFGPGSVEEQRADVQSERGFAALYYPWLMVREPLPPTAPRPPVPRTIFIPPSGHIAGIYARTDAERGVHKAPANTNVRGVLGLERRLSDEQQGPLNLRGINVLRIFPGSSQVIVWGGRTTVDPIVTDWIYVNVRRLMLYIEESIEEGIRWAVFEPNNLALWQKLKRTIGEFLSRIWRDGGLFGATPEEAYYVRIDEALNPPATRALGRLYIEIGVAPVRPAEFIIVRIGLWDGGSEVAES